MIRKRLLIVAACSLAIFASVYAPAARAWTRQATPASAPSHPLDYPNVPPPDYYTGDPDFPNLTDNPLYVTFGLNGLLQTVELLMPWDSANSCLVKLQVESRIIVGLRTLPTRRP